METQSGCGSCRPPGSEAQRGLCQRRPLIRSSVTAQAGLPSPLRTKEPFCGVKPTSQMLGTNAAVDRQLAVAFLDSCRWIGALPGAQRNDWFRWRLIFIVTLANGR